MRWTLTTRVVRRLRTVTIRSIWNVGPTSEGTPQSPPRVSDRTGPPIPAMARARVLCDEDTPRGLEAAICHLEPAMDVLRVGDLGAPPRGTLDPDLLLAAEQMGRLLVSRDKKTMPRHLIRHFASGHHTS